MDIEKVRSRFIKHFDGKTGNIYMSPGRINLIGEHTDYNKPCCHRRDRSKQMSR